MSKPSFSKAMFHGFLNSAVDNWKGNGTHAWERLAKQSIVFSALCHLYGQLRSKGAY